MRGEQAHGEAAGEEGARELPEGQGLQRLARAHPLDGDRARPRRWDGAVGGESHRLRRVPDHPQAERQHDHEDSGGDEHVRRAPPRGDDEPGHARHEQAHPRHRRAAEHGERGAASLAEPSGDHAGGDHGPGAGETEGNEHAVDGSELPEVLHHRGQHERGHEEQRARGGDGAHAEAVEDHAGQRHEDTVEEEAQGDHRGEARAIEPEVADDRLEEGPHRVADARRHERRDGKGRHHPPAVEDLALSHSMLPGTTPAGSDSTWAQMSRGRVSHTRSPCSRMCWRARRSRWMRYGRPMTKGCREIGHTRGWRADCASISSNWSMIMSANSSAVYRYQTIPRVSFTSIGYGMARMRPLRVRIQMGWSSIVQSIAYR